MKASPKTYQATDSIRVTIIARRLGKTVGETRRWLKSLRIIHRYYGQVDRPALLRDYYVTLEGLRQKAPQVARLFESPKDSTNA